MAKSFIDVVQDSPRTGPGIPVKTKKPLSQTNTPAAQVVIYHSKQVVWNLFPHYRLDADIPPRGIERIAYVNVN